MIDGLDWQLLLKQSCKFCGTSVRFIRDGAGELVDPLASSADSNVQAHT